MENIQLLFWMYTLPIRNSGFLGMKITGSTDFSNAFISSFQFWQEVPAGHYPQNSPVYFLIFFKYITSNFRKQMVTFPKNSLTTSLIHWSGYTIFYCSLSKYLARKRDVSFLFVKIPPSLKQLCLKWGRNNSGENNLSPEIIVDNPLG